MDEKKVTSVLKQVHKILNKNKLSVAELVLFYGNLGYQIGAAMAGFHTNGPDQDTLQEEYYKNPSVDISMMLQGLLITSWVDDYLKSPRLSGLKNKLEEKK